MEVVALAGDMEKSFYSPSWYRVASLKPRLRSHARILRQHFRGQLWYVLQDPASGRFHRFTPAAYLLISLMNGNRTVREIWELACSRVGDDVLTQDEMIQLLAQLYQVDVLHADVPPDIEEMSARASKVSRRKLAMSLMNPLALRLPLLDPDVFLTATLPAVRPLFSRIGASLIAVVVGCAMALAAVHWAELTANVFDRVLVWESLVLLIVTYPFVKILHELGHAYAVKCWGGEVHELGLMLLVFLPVPYVDASSSAAFPEKWRRALVGAAGIIVELVLASLALFVWLDVEEGLLRAFTYNVMLIGGVSTILFNGNPLLRFDGYYVLADLLEIPNLADRAKRFINYLIIRNLFGVKGAASPATSPGEPFWFILYGVSAFCYRVGIVLAIILVVAAKFFVIGAVLAIWSCVIMVGVPSGKAVWFLFTSPVLARQRRRAIGISAGVVTAIAIMLLLVPVPYRTVAEGIIWTPGEASVFARTEGTVVALLSEPNSFVSRGDPLIRLEDPLLDAKVRVLEASVRELELRRIAVAGSDPLQKQLFEEQLDRAKGDLDLHRKRTADLVVRSPGDGRFVLRRPNELLGKFAHRGEIVAFVATFDSPIVRLVVPEDELDLVRTRPESIEIRLVDKIDAIYPGFILREIPNISDRLPSLALGTPGGGNVVIDPRDPKNPKAMTKLLQIELGFREPLSISEMGGRVYARFDHGNEPLAWRFYRDLRQLFLRRFNV
jgi:putative peptide zinc metalloprotease protein